jgi:hypothetical protein
MADHYRKHIKTVGWIGRQRTRHSTTWDLTPPPAPNFGSVDPARVGWDRREKALQVQKAATRHPFYLSKLKTLLDALRHP